MPTLKQQEQNNRHQSDVHSSASKNPVKAAFRLVQQVWEQPVTVTAFDKGDKQITYKFRYLDVIGNGTFGVVCRARDLSTHQIVAIKTVYQDEGHQNRELSIIKSLNNDNIVDLLGYFYTRNEVGEDFLSLILEWMPTSMDRLLRDNSKHPERIAPWLIQRSFQQFILALQYLHGKGISHRDIKPHNLLLDISNGMVKLCDFGCSKKLIPGEGNIQYICARYYRAPEIVLGWSKYSPSIDIWSAGCVLAELLTGEPIFPGKNSIDQLAKIVKVLGSPTPSDMEAMGQAPTRIGSKEPLTEMEKWTQIRLIIPSTHPDSVIDLLMGCLSYDPIKRWKPSQILSSSYLSSLDGKVPKTE